MSYTVSLCIICIVTCGLRTKSLCLCVHVIQACTVQLPLVVIIMTLDTVPIDMSSDNSIYSLLCVMTANT